MHINRDLPALPEKWLWVSLGDILSFIGSGVTPKGGSRQYQQSGIPFLRSQNILPGSIMTDELVYISHELHEELSRTHIEPNDILLNITGASIGRSAVVSSSFGQGNVNQHVCILRPFSCICSRYVSWFLNSSIGQMQIMSSQSGVTRQGLNYEQIRALSIPLAPQSLQYIISSRIEELFSDLDTGVNAISRMKKLLERYHRSILKAALQGELTNHFRELHPEMEPPFLLSGRTTDDNQFLEKARIVNYDSNKTLKNIPSEIANQSLINSYKFPSKWVWSNFGAICERVTVGYVGTMKDRYAKEGVPFLRSQNVRENRFSPIGLKFITNEFHEELAKSKLEPGDIVVTRSGNTGVSCVIPETLKDANCADLIIIKRPKIILSQYGAFYINSLARSLVNSQRVGVAIRHFNTKSMQKMPIPIPPLLEQQQILSKIENATSIVNKIDKIINNAIKKSQYLRQSILIHAFLGKLTSHIEKDETASSLLALINEEKNKPEYLKKPVKHEKKIKLDISRKESVIYDILVQEKTKITPEDLFYKAGFDEDTIEDFYKELRKEIIDNRIQEIRPNKAEIYLKVTENENR